MAADVHEGGDEGYFASISDLMVGVLFVFLLLLTVFALNLRDEQDVSRTTFEKLLVELDAQKRAAEESKAQAQLEQERATDARREAELQKAAAIRERTAAETRRLRNAELLAALNKALAQLENESRGREQARTQLLDQLKSSLETRGVQVITIPEAGILRLPEDVLFGKGERALAREAGPRLKVLAEALGGTLPCFAQRNLPAGCDATLGPVLDAVLVEGHADRQRWAPPRDSQEENDRLSADRALTVFKQLRRDNPALDTMTSATGRALLAVSAYGDRRPAVAGETEDAYRQNRRIDLRFLISSRPSDELQQLIESIRRTLQDAS